MAASKIPKVIHQLEGPSAESEAAKILGDGRVLRSATQPELLARELVGAGRIEHCRDGSFLCKQGEDANDVFFVLCGTVQIWVKGQQLAVRRARDVVGEMAFLSPVREKRSATMVAGSDTWVLRVPSDAFQRIADSSIDVWRGVARELGGRLRERNTFVPVANDRPRAFLGSSVENLLVLDHVVKAIEHKCWPVPWTQSFRPSRYTIDELLNQVCTCDFAIFVFAPDDTTKMRNRRLRTARDNVLFEVGLFMGALGRERTLLLAPRGLALHIPTDLSGLKIINYTIEANGAVNIAAAGAELRGAIEELGPRKVRAAASDNQ